MKKHLLLITLLCAAFFSACSKQTPENSSAEEPALEEQSSEAPVDNKPRETYTLAADSINALGYDLFAGMASENENVCISPYSIELALGMAVNGASGATRDEMLGAMHIENLDLFNRSVKASKEKLERDAMDICIANSVWYDKNLTFSDSFETSYLPLLNDSYAAEALARDFTDASILSEMNGWIARATNDKITDMLPEIPKDSILVLLNAIYFNAEWEVPFPMEGTYDEVFHCPSGDQTVSFMHLNEGYFQYVEYGGIKALRMHYKDSDMAMDLFIPADKEQNVTELFNGFTFEEKKELYQKLSDSEEILIASLQLPRFEFSPECISLRDVLIELGMAEAFFTNADFSLISEDAFISQVYHKAFIRVDEDGTQAAAATAVMMSRGALILDEDPISFEADVPFMYHILDTSDGTILFMGNMSSIGEQD